MEGYICTQVAQNIVSDKWETIEFGGLLLLGTIRAGFLKEDTFELAGKDPEERKQKMCSFW